MALSREELASSAVGLVPTDHAAGLPSKQSTTGLRHAFRPPGSANSVMSVSHSSSGADARNRLATRFSGALETSPA